MTTPIEPSLVERFCDIIADRLGLALHNRSPDAAHAAITARMGKSSSAGAYIDWLETQAGREELRELSQLLTVAESYFFRNHQQFTAWLEVAVPDCLRARSDPTLRMLSAGCAAGEEPYSLAILARETYADSGPAFSILGVDLNPSVLNRARLGRYSTWALRETSEGVRRRWFRSDNRFVALDETIRSAVTFVEANIAADDHRVFGSNQYDVIFCRNVLMYFTPDKYRETVRRLAQSLTPGGYLFLGHAETLRGVSDDFSLCHTHGAFYYRRKEAARRAVPAPARSPPLRHPTQACVPARAAWIDTIGQATARVQALSAQGSGAPHNAQIEQTGRHDLSIPLDLLKKEQFSQALDLMKLLPRESASDPDVLLLEAALLAHGAEYEAAGRVCRRLLEIDELNAGAHYVLALCHEANSNAEKAIYHDQVAAYLDPAFAMPRVHLGLLWRRIGNQEAARRELFQARSLLEQEDAARLLLFGGGFGRSALLELCTSELEASGGS